MSSDSEEGRESASAADAATTGYSDWEGLTWGPTKTNPGLKQGANSRGIKALALAHFNWAEGQAHRINTISRLKQWEDDSPALKDQAAETLTVEQLIVRLEQEGLGEIPASPSTQEEKDDIRDLIPMAGAHGPGNHDEWVGYVHDLQAKLDAKPKRH